METDEIGIVVARASKINAKINDAIGRAMKSDIILNKARIEPRTCTRLDNNESCSQAVDLYMRLSSHGEECGNANQGVEARNLVSIRDALDVLEEQLECLQSLQQQQQVEKDAALADIEESRINLLGRLRNYQGREWEVVHEALTFAGETDEGDDLPLPPYPHMLPDNFSFGKYSNCPDHFLENNAINQPAWTEENEELLVSEVDERSQIGDEERIQMGDEAVDNEYMQKGQMKTRDIMGSKCNRILRCIGNPVGKAVALAAKTGIVAAGLVAIVTLVETVQDKQKRGTIGRASNAPTEKSLSFQPNGDHRIIEGKYPPDMQKFGQEEHNVLPSQPEARFPDVFYGRG